MKKLVQVLALIVCVLLSNLNVWGQKVWVPTSANGAWLTAANWSPSGVPTSASIAQFSNAATGCGINTNNTAANNAAALDFQGTASFTLGSSTSSANGTLTLAGVTVNSVANTIVRNSVANNLNLAPNIGSSTSTLTYVLGNSTNNLINIDSSGNITISSIISGVSRNLTKAGLGTGVLTLSGINTYSGNTTISAGTLALSGSGSIANSPQIIVGSGGTFNVTGLTTALSLGASQSLRSSATGGNTTATLTVSSTKGLTLSAGGLAFTAYGGGSTAPLAVTGASAGALALNGAPVTVTTTTALAAGTYKLVAKGGSATGVTGTPGALTVGGSGLSGTGSLSVVSGELILTVTASGSPTLAAGALSGGFGNVCVNTPASANPSFTITGSDLTSTDVSVSGDAAYTFATTAGGAYSNPLNLGNVSCSGNSCYSQAIFVKFTPTAAISYGGNVTVSGGGATAATTAVTGSGVNPVSISVNPADQTVAVGSPATFTVTAANATSYAWFQDPNSGTFGSALTTGGVYTVSGNTLTVTPSATSFTNYKYKVEATGVCGTVTSTPSTGAVLTVTAAPVSIWSNPITDADPSLSNPYTTGDVKAANITVSGIGRGSGISGATTSNRYSTNGWDASNFTFAFNNNEFFTFTLTPDAVYRIDFSSLTFAYQRSNATGSPSNYAIRSSADSYGSDIATGTLSGTSATTISGINLSSLSNVTSAIIFRIYAWGGNNTSSTLSINDFNFFGNVSPLVCTGTPSGITLTPASPPALCDGYASPSGITLGLTGTVPVNSLYQWKYATTSGGTYNDISGATSATYVIPTGLTGNGNWYQCMVTCGGNSATSDNKQIIINALPSAPGTPSGPTTVCPSASGNVYTVAPVSGTTYNWSVSGTDWSIPSSSSTNSVTVTSGTITGTVSVTATKDGCTSSASQLTNITLRPVPVFTPTALGLCQSGTNGSVVVSDAASGSFGTGTGAATGVSFSGTDPNYSFAPGSVLGTRTYTYTASNGCSKDFIVTVSVPPSAPTFTTPTTTQNLTTVCSNATGLTYQATGGTTYNWSFPSGWTFTGGTGATVTVTAIGSSGTISVTSATGGCTSSAATLSVTVNTAPNIGSINGPTSICQNTSGFKYTVNNIVGATYTWGGTSTANSWTYSGASTFELTANAGTGNKTFTVTVTDINGCTSTASVAVNTTTPLDPTVVLTTPSSNICTNVSHTFTASPTNGGTSPSYQWKVNGVNAGTNSNTFTSSFNAEDNIWLVMTADASACVTTTTATSNIFFAKGLAYNPTIAWTETFGTGGTTPYASYTGYTNTASLSFSGTGDVRTTIPSSNVVGAPAASAGSNSFIQVGNTMIVSGINTSNAFPNKFGFYIYKSATASDGTDLKIEVSTDGTNYYQLPSVSLLPSGVTWYYREILSGIPKANNVRLRFTNESSGAYRIDDLSLTKYETSNAAIDNSGSATICTGNNVTLTANPASGTTLNYAWTGGSTANSITASTSGTRNLTITDGFGCTSSASVTINVNPNVTYYKDADNDGYSDGTTQISCTGAPTGYIATSLGADCDDNDANKNVTYSFYADTDNDGFGAGSLMSGLCATNSTTPPSGYSTNNTDCAPTDNTKWQLLSGYADADGDGYTVGALLNNICSGAALTSGYSATSSGSDCDDNNAVLTTNCTGFTWTGATDYAWSEPTNWSPASVPNDCTHNVTIPTISSNTPTLSGNITIGNITLGDNKTIYLDANQLNVCGNWTGGTSNSGSTIGNGAVVLNGSSPQTISGKTSFYRLRLNNSNGATLQTGANVNINKVVELQTGTLAINGQTMTFKSTSATDYAILDNFSSGYTGTLSGNATAERYVPVTGINQHYLGSPVTNTSFAQLGASGTSGFVIPTPNCDQLNVANNSPYGNIFQWHDNIPANATCLYNGWEVKTTGTAQAGRGYSVYLPNGTFSITGQLNQGNSYSISGLDDIGWESNTFQTAGITPKVYKSGWHIVANPYLAPLQLSGHSADFSSAAVWVTSGTYAGSYQPVSITGGQIAPFQGFIVRRSAASAATFTFNKSECITTPGIQFYKTASEHQLSLQVSGNGFNDITRVEFNSATTNAFDVDYDAFKPMSALGQPTLSSFNTDITERLAINVNKSIAETPNVQLNFVPGNNGTFSFTVDGINTFDPTSYITLEDTKEGTMTDLRQNPTYTFAALKTDNHNRFVLHFTPAAAITTVNGTCTENGTLSVTQDGPADWNYTITSSNDTTTIAAGTLNSTSPLNQALPMGTYQITLTDNSGYQVIKNVQVNGQTPIAAATMTTSNTNVEEDQPITLLNTTSNTTTTEWNFGDGNTATTNTVDHTYTEPGIYTVTLTVTNAVGCIATTTQTITVTEKLNTGITTTTKESIHIYPNPVSTMLNINLSQVTADTKLTLTNALGQTIQTQDKLKQGVNTIEVSQLAEGLYLITVNEGKAVLTTQRIVISQ